MHPFVFLSIFEPFGEHRHQFAQHFRWEYDQSRKDGTALRVCSKNKLCADAKVGTASADAPEQLGVFGFAESQRRSIRRDDSCLSHPLKMWFAPNCKNGAYLKEIINDKPILTCEEAIAASKEKP